MVLVLRRQTRRVLAGLLAACGVCLVGIALYTTPGLRAAAELAPLRGVPTKTKDVALTFDISWGTVMPPKVADILRDYGVEATIFISGPWAARHPDFVRRLAAEGHELASHGYRHSNMSQWSEGDIESAIARTHDIIQEISGQSPTYIRPPNGDYDDLVIATAARLGYTVVIWSLDSLDWLNPGVDRIIDRLLTRAEPGDIILMHASDTCRQTDQALPAVIEGLRAKGLDLVPLGKLLDRARSVQ